MVESGPFSIYIYSQNKPIEKINAKRQKGIQDVLKLYTSNQFKLE